MTPVWWNDLWLNEGFASWIQYLGSAYANPTWKEVIKLSRFEVPIYLEANSLFSLKLEYFVVTRLNVYFEDSLETSHPISVSVNDPTEISALFDSISYDKGSYIIRMMNAFLSENTFTKGVTVNTSFTTPHQLTLEDFNQVVPILKELFAKIFSW